MGGTAHPRVAFRVLGPLEAVVDGRTVALGSPKVRQLLAALLVNANAVVSTDRLVEILWGESAPVDASGALQKNVHRLRSLLEARPDPRTDDADVLVTRVPGYVLTVDAESYDAAHLEELVAEAQRSSELGDPRAALDALDDALALWRGAAFAEFASDDFARTEATRLEELRVAAIEERVETLLALGRHDEVTGELDALVAEYPYRERLWGQLMLALYRSGRQADALRAFSRVRTLLGEELGIDPGASLRDLEEAILLQKPELDWVPATAPLGGGAPRAPSRPALPTALARDELLVGRSTEMAWLDDLLARAEQGPVGARLRGESGSGRTTLVAAFGRRAFEQGCAVLYTTVPTGASTGAWSGFQSVLDEVPALCEVAQSTAKPVVLIVDDVHRAEPDTLAVLERLIQSPELAPLLLITTTAGTPKTVVPSCWTERTLAPFGERDVATVLEARLGNAPSPELAEAVLEETGGNPRRVDDVATRLAEAELDERVARAVARAAVAQRDLRTMQHEIATSVGERSRRVGPARAGADTAAAGGVVACPYKGLAPFDASDAAFFCGRDRLVDELVARLAVARFVAVIGPSGSGKSSLVRAGLVPALARGALPGSREWQTLTLRPGDAFELPADGRVTLVVDQLEEVFTTAHDERARATFLDALARTATDPDGRATVVVAFRGDSLDRFAAFAPFARLIGESQLLVGPMSDADVHAAIEEPAHRAGLTLEAGLPDAIAADVAGQPGGLPLLSTALLETWVRRRGPMLTHAGYHEAGGVAGAVARLAEDTYAQFTPDEKVVCRRLLMRLAEPGTGPGGRPDDMRRRVPLAELAAAGDVSEARVLETLVARRLVTAGDGTAEVAHEALLREWPRLRGWLDEDRDGRRIHHRVAAAATEWDAGGRDATELYRGTRLDAALDWSAAHPDDPNPLEREFLAAAGAAHDHELRAARRTARRLRSLTIGLAVLLVVALVAGTVALVQRGNANQQASRANDAATLARATQLATEARTLPATQNDLALLLGVEGRRLQPSPTTDGGLEAAIVHRPPGLERVVHFGTPAAYASLSDDGRFVVAPGNDGNVRIYDFATGRLLHTLRGNGEPAIVAQFNDDASLVVTGGIHGKVTIWRVATGKPIGPPVPAGGNVVYGVFGGTTRLFTVSDKGTVARWDFADPQHPVQAGEPFTFPVGAGDVPVVAFSGAAGNLMAVGGSSTQRTTLFDLTTHQVMLQVNGTAGSFSPDGRLLATTLGDRVVLWDVATGADREELLMGSHLAATLPPTFSPDGSRLAAADQDDSAVRVFDVASGEQAGPPLVIHSSFGAAGGFLPGNRLVTFGTNEAAVWNLGRRVPPLETDFDDHTGGPVDTENGAIGQFTPDGSEIVTVGIGDHRVIARDATTGKSRGDLLGRREVTEFLLAFSPDHKVIASGDVTGGRVTLWDRASGRELAHFDTGADGSTAVAWDPQKPILATSTGAPGSTSLWDVSDLRHPVRRHALPAAAGYPWFSPDGRLLVITDAFGTKTGTVFDAATGRKLLSFGGDYALGDVSFTPDSHTMAATIGEFNGSGTAVLYDTTTWRHQTLALTYDPHGIAFIDNGSRFVTLSYLTGGRVDLWDTATLQPVGEPLTLTTDDNYSAEANARGTKVAFGSFRGVTPVLDVSPTSWQRTACRLAGRNFTRAEWAQYFPGEAYRRTCARWPAGP